MITDKMVEKAFTAEHQYGNGIDDYPTLESMRAALEAIVHDFRNQVIEECAAAAEWYHNVETFKAPQVARRIRSLKTKE